MNLEEQACHYLRNAAFEDGKQQLLVFEKEGKWRVKNDI